MRIKLLFVCMLSVILLTSCSSSKEPKTSDEESIETVQTVDHEQMIQSDLINQTGEKIGNLTFQQLDEFVLIHLLAENLSEGVHGIHVHETGMCEGPDFTSAGGHFNPGDKSHGFNHPKGPHAGDLPNIYVPSDGTVDVYMTANLVTLEKGEKHSIRQDDGTSIIIHSKRDDYYSQPAGDAGERIACSRIF